MWNWSMSHWKVEICGKVPGTDTGYRVRSSYLLDPPVFPARQVQTDSTWWVLLHCMFLCTWHSCIWLRCHFRPFLCSSSSGGGVLGPDGAVYFIPRCSDRLVLCSSLSAARELLDWNFLKFQARPGGACLAGLRRWGDCGSCQGWSIGRCLGLHLCYFFLVFSCFLIFFSMLPADAFPNAKDGINSKERFLHEMDASMAFRCFAAVWLRKTVSALDRTSPWAICVCGYSNTCSRRVPFQYISGVPDLKQIQVTGFKVASDWRQDLDGVLKIEPDRLHSAR